MEKRAAEHRVSPLPDLDNDDSGNSTRANPTTLPQEAISLKILPSTGIRPASRRGDSSFTDLSGGSSANASKIILGGHPTELDHIVEPINEQPRWLQHSSAKSRALMKSLLKRPGISHVVDWMKGPSPSRPYKIKPFFPRLQAWPTSTLSKYLSPASSCTLITAIVCILWLIAFTTTLATSPQSMLTTPGARAPVRLACVSRIWVDAPSCGTDGRFCQPFQGESFSFICPSGCASVELLNPKTIGNQDINYRTLVVGGPSAAHQNLSIYRGDSFICPAAVHAGVISNKLGGCGILNREGTQSNFASADQNGVRSIGFQPNFPLSFSFAPESGSCKDPQWYALTASICSTALISLIATPSWLFFSATFTITFFQIALASDSPNAFDYASVISMAFERFLPATFVGIALYRYCVSRTMRDLRAYWERTVLWLGGCWVGALNAYTFDRIPVSRLTAHDLRLQPGAIVALIIVVAFVLAAAIGQIWAFRVEGRLPRFLGLYILIGVIIGCLAAIPGLDLRLHHYIIGLLLLPGTSIQTRPSLLYQGLLLGLFINGIARWGFAGILQTPGILFLGAQTGSDLPQISTPNIVADTISFTIANIPYGFDGVSAVINDVERFQVTNASVPVVYNYTRSTRDEVSFIRFAFTGTYTLGGITYGDYTRPGTWLGNGTWIDMLPGRSST